MSEDQFHKKMKLEEGMGFAKVRALTCQFCPHVRHLPVLGPQCKLCGCLMRIKSHMPDATCPDNRWKV